MVYVELTRQDGQGVRTLADIERKYNLPSLLKNIEIQRGELIKIENELNNTISSLIINLSGLVDNQGEASLWFFFGVPNASVEPESNWYDKSTLQNLVTNGDFSNGTTGWTAFNGTHVVANNIYSITGNGISRFVYTEKSLPTKNSKYYIKLKFRVTNTSATQIYVHMLGRTSGGKYNVINIPTPIQNTWYERTAITDITNAVGTDIIFRVVEEYVDNPTANGKVMEVQQVSCIDLTAIFGAGNEPTKEEMDIIMAMRDKLDHIGDLYYDKGTGRVYQYLSDYTWVERQDARLVQAMALTNAVAEEERKIFFSQPTPPYSNGDWWIKDNGDLWICQITRTTGSYTEDDFIKSSLFAPSENMTEANQFTILSGAITLIRQGINIIEQTVSTHTQSLNNITGELALISENYTTQTQTATQISLAVAQVNQAIETAKGEITSVTTTTGYTFNNIGLAIAKTGEELSSLITNEGFYVYRDKDETSEVTMLSANSTGVNAENITVRKFFTAGTHSRTEDYIDELGAGTGVFFLSGGE